MLEFEVIRWMNLLSTGNEFTEVILNKTKNTLIVGENGAGKSTLLDALFFVLFGKPYRKVNKGQLINSITRKNLLVELEFKVYGRQYKIRRGIKPNIFEIYCDGEMIKQPASVDEYQSILENTILRFKMKSFAQYSILGSANYVPFMRLTAAHRREVIEDVLDLEIFSTMNVLLKGRADENAKLLVDIEHSINTLEHEIEAYRKMVEIQRKNNDELIARKRVQLETYNKELIDKTETRVTLEKNVEALNVLIQEKQELAPKLNKLLEAQRAYEDKVRSLKEHLGFIENGTACPTCKQEIAEEFKEQHRTKTVNQLEKLEAAYQPIHAKIIDTKRKDAELDERIRGGAPARDTYNRSLVEEAAIKRSIREIEEDIKTLSTPTKSDVEGQNDIKQLHEKLASTKLEFQDLLKKKKVFDDAKKLLKDDGIKTAIIREYIPIINQLINKYLQALDFFVSFELDENFNETIKSRFRDEFSYESFSEGEKMRINLAILFAWRGISRKRNSSPTNLLIMDEVFDSSLDHTGTEEMINIIENLTEDSNTFIISHKGDALYDHFRSVIKFEKHNNFSKMVARA